MSIGETGAEVNNLVNTKKNDNNFDIKKFSILRIFRIFRVFRVAKVLRKVKEMRIIINGIFKSIYNILYTISLLFLFIIIFLMIGMKLLYVIPDFKDFLYAFYVVFQALTMENYNMLVYNMAP